MHHATAPQIFAQREVILSSTFKESELDFPEVDYDLLLSLPTTSLSRIPDPVRTQIRALTDRVISLRLRNAAFSKLRSRGYELEALAGFDNASHSLVPLSSKMGHPILLNVYACPQD